MITRLSIAFEDFLGSSIASQVMPPWTQTFKNTPRGGPLVLLLFAFQIWTPKLQLLHEGVLETKEVF